ncbi:hypothetical protein FGRA07_09570 [Fusarium graminearum]|nr:hypothetical protein FGRA07_09570 [Fusarium graminearum]
MTPPLIADGKIQIIAQTVNSIVYAVDNDSNTELAKDSPFVLKCGTVWYKRRQALGPGKDIDESNESIRKEVDIYETLGQHDRILKCLERSPLGSLPYTIIDTYKKPPSQLIRLQLAHQFSEGVTYLHHMEIIWGDLSTRNVFLSDNWQLKLGDFVDSDNMDAYPSDWYGCEDRYCPLGSDNPAMAVIQKIWGYSYETSSQVVHDLQALFLSCE